jgi:hypothetical protein
MLVLEYDVRRKRVKKKASLALLSTIFFGLQSLVMHGVRKGHMLV